MGITEWGRLWRGYLLISAEGPGLTKLLNLTTRQGIKFWDLHYRENRAVLKIAPRDLKRLRPLLKKTACRVKIEDKRGLPFLLLGIKRRRGLLLGIFLFCAALYFLSFFIWEINIEGNKELKTKEIRRVLENYGIREGIWKKNLDLAELERMLLFHLDGLKWVGASINGVFLNIQIVEGLREPPPEEGWSVLVAAKDGLVTKILVLAGEALVKEGETVQKGQELIAGKIMFPEKNGEQRGNFLEIKPKGVVEALVWYESYAEAPLYQVKKRKTGRCTRYYALVVKGREYPLRGSPASPYRNYEMEKIKRTFMWRNLRLPVELSSTCYWEYEVDMQFVSPVEALQKARTLALEEVAAQLPTGALISKRFINDFYFFELGKVGCRVMVETRENIAVPGTFEDAT